MSKTKKIFIEASLREFSSVVLFGVPLSSPEMNGVKPAGFCLVFNSLEDFDAAGCDRSRLITREVPTADGMGW